MNINLAASECNIANAILVASFHYGNSEHPDTEITESLMMAARASLERALHVIQIELSKPSSGSPSTIGTRIQLTRENLGIHEVDLARLLNTYSDHITDWECGITEPAASMIIPLANALKCDPMWLLTGEPVAIARES